MVRRGLIALAAAAAISACSSPSSFMDAMQTEVKSSLGMFLAVVNTKPANNASKVNPSDTITIDFDRSLSPSSITADAIVIAASGSPLSPVPWTYAYDDVLKRLTVQPAPLEGGTLYIVTIGAGLAGSQGESLKEAYVFSFTSDNLPSGSMSIDSGDYTNTRSLSLTLAANQQVDRYLCSESPTAFDGSPAFLPLPGTWPKLGFALSASDPEGSCTVYIQYMNSGSGNKTPLISDSVILDMTPPGAATIFPPASTATHYPIWSWSGISGDGGNGTFSYRLYDSTHATNIVSFAASPPRSPPSTRRAWAGSRTPAIGST